MATNDTDSKAQALEQSQTTKLSQPAEETPGRSGNEYNKDGTDGTSKTTDLADKARDWTGHALDFLSHASNETLGACIVALGAATWLVLGRLGLVLIGIFGGIVLHATWEDDGRAPNDTKVTALDARKRREKGLDIARRTLDWRENTKSDGQRGDIDDKDEKLTGFSSFRLETSAALTTLTDTIISNYVKWWYTPLLPQDESFPNTCRQVLTSFLVALSSHLSRKRPADTFLDFLTNSSSIVIVFLSELSAALKETDSPGDAADVVHEFLEANPSSSLANVLDIQQQQGKLNAIAEEIIRSFVDTKAYTCEPVRAFLREILAGLILEKTIMSCSQAEFINDWIIYSLEEGNKELLEAFDAGVSGATANGTVKSSLDVGTGRSSPSDAHDEEPPNNKSQSQTEHKRTVSRAEDAMEEAMREARRLTELIAAEEANKEQSPPQVSSSGESTTSGVTPASSRDDVSALKENAMLPIFENGDGSEPAELTSPTPAPSFTTFDQIISSQKPTALQKTMSLPVAPLTLHNASISIFDDSLPNEKNMIRSKPTADYLLQVEPATAQHPGWMIARVYSDFETLHEVLRRISVVSGVAAFADRHQTVPGWKAQTKARLRKDLEHYLRDALSFQRLAESEGMKRFLEKDQGLGRSSPGTGKGGFGFPTPAAFETMGKGMLDVLASAPKGAAGGGKAILGGVTGVFGGVGSIGQKRQAGKTSIGRVNNAPNTSSGAPSANFTPSSDSGLSARSSIALGRESHDSLRDSIGISEPEKPPPLPRRQSQAPSIEDNGEDAKAFGFLEQFPNDISPGELHLPPPPSEMTDDYGRGQMSRAPQPREAASSSIHSSDDKMSPPSKPVNREGAPLNSQETSVAVELFFAIINELYALSSAWTLRLTLLNAAKSFLLRPGNPNLEAIRVLLQTSIIDDNIADAGIANHLLKIRENTLPTEEELKSWPPPLSKAEKERKRQKARKLLVEKGMPQALTSVMGAAASGEALGRVFDFLQVPEVARGLVFALILQAVRAATQ